MDYPKGEDFIYVPVDPTEEQSRLIFSKRATEKLLL
jgi:hypothetical protein